MRSLSYGFLGADRVWGATYVPLDSIYPLTYTTPAGPLVEQLLLEDVQHLPVLELAPLSRFVGADLVWGATYVPLDHVYPLTYTIPVELWWNNCCWKMCDFY